MMKTHETLHGTDLCSTVQTGVQMTFKKEERQRERERERERGGRLSPPTCEDEEGEVRLLYINTSWRNLGFTTASRNHGDPASIIAQTMADESFKKEFLKSHNDYRAAHGAEPMTLNEELTAAAQKWADHMLEVNQLQHSKTNDGENVFYKSSTATLKLTGKEAVDSWYAEIKDYNFKNPGFQGNTGHFTQVVWKSSTELGVGMATDGNTAFVVGQYRPAGNISNPGYFQDNVSPKA
ncbi:Golgi-associated plant pathogenesis-related protein 1 [Salarias fasciatus]|nr:Golgi-associated plant pathogenesis-related protein 1-like [Salarias fasciatus]